MDARPENPATGAARRRSGLGCLLSGGLGCGAFLFGSILAVALFAPQLLGGWLARGAERMLQDHVDGRVTVGGAELSWSDDLRLRDVTLADAEGHVLARGTLRLPALGDLFSGADAKLLRVRTALQEVRLTLGEDGVLDLARAFRWDEARPAGQRVEPVAALWSRLAGVAHGQHPPFLVEVRARTIALIDARVTSGRGPEPRPEAGLEFGDVVMEFGRATAESPASFQLACAVSSHSAPGQVPELPGQLRVTLELARPEAELPSGVALVIEGEGLPSRAVASLLEALSSEARRSEVGGPPAEFSDLADFAFLSELTGERLDLALSVRGDLARGADVEVRLVAPRGAFACAGRIEAGVLTSVAAASPGAIDGTARPTEPGLTWSVPAPLLERALAPLLPEAWSLSASPGAAEGPGAPAVAEDARASVQLRLDGLRCDTGLGRGWAPQWTLEELAVDAKTALRLAVVAASAPEASHASEGPPTASGAELAIVDPLVLVRWLGPLGGTASALWRAQGGPRTASVTLRLDGALQAGEGRPRPPGSGWRALRDATLRGVRMDVDLPGLPVELLRVAASLPAEGAALLGEAVRLQASGLELGLAPDDPARGNGARGRGPIDFSLEVGPGRSVVRGRIEDGVARAAGGPQALRLDANAENLARVLGPVLPWVDRFAPAAPGATLVVAFDALEVPLDGGALRPSGGLEFLAPPLRVQVAHGVTALFGGSEGTEWTAWSPRRFRIDLQNELVRYPSVELPIAGDVYGFTGTFDRKTRSVDLEGEVPARLVQDRQWARPELAELLLDSEVRVFVNLSGQVAAPRLMIDRDAVQGMLSRDLQRALNEVGPALKGVIEQLVPSSETSPSPPAPPRRAPGEPGSGGD